MSKKARREEKEIKREEARGDEKIRKRPSNKKGRIKEKEMGRKEERRRENKNE